MSQRIDGRPRPRSGKPVKVTPLTGRRRARAGSPNGPTDGESKPPHFCTCIPKKCGRGRSADSFPVQIATGSRNGPKSGRRVGLARLTRRAGRVHGCTNRPANEEHRRWVFIEMDLAEFVRSRYPEKRRALPVGNSDSEGADQSGSSTSSLRTMKEYEKLLKLPARARPRSPRAR
jgi:hypothetical protein